jgi:hypothetical protein
MRWLLRLYPRRWRSRYGEEMAGLLASEGRGTRLAVDLLLGALDAHLNPQRVSGPTAKGADVIKRARRGVLRNILVGLGAGAAGGLVMGLILGFWPPSNIWTRAAMVATMIAVFFGLAQWLILRKSGGQR